MKILPKNVLAIEDSLTLRKFIEKSLTGESCINHLLFAPDARSGLEMAVESKPDLILCDYTLPDLQGDEVCRQLGAHPETATIPIVLMSSSGREIATLVKEGTNVVRLLVKPFTRELLVATISYVLSHWEEKRSIVETVQAAGRIQIRGSTDASPICSALRFIARQKWTGVLRVTLHGDTVHAFCSEGCVRVVSTRNVPAYLAGTPYLSTGRKSAVWKRAEDLQKETLSPFLLNLSEVGVLPQQTAATLTDLYGHRLFAQVWKEKGVNYEFEETALPEFVSRARPGQDRMNDWILESLRNVDSADDILDIVGDPYGVPVFTASGYRQIQEVTPHEDEWQVLTLVNGDTSLTEICRRLSVPPEVVARKIFCYLRLGFIDYWPSYLFQAQPQN